MDVCGYSIKWFLSWCVFYKEQGHEYCFLCDIDKLVCMCACVYIF